MVRCPTALLDHLSLSADFGPQRERLRQELAADNPTKIADTLKSLNDLVAQAHARDERERKEQDAFIKAMDRRPQEAAFTVVCPKRLSC